MRGWIFLVMLLFVAAPTAAQDAPPEVTVTPDVNLGQTYMAANIGYTFHYPSDWYTDDLAYDVMVSNQPIGEHYTPNTPVPTGTVQITLAVFFIDSQREQDFQARGLTLDSSPLEILQKVIEALPDKDSYLAPQAAEIDTLPAANIVEQGSGFEHQSWLIEFRRGLLGTVDVYAASGELESWEPTAVAIAESIDPMQAPLALTKTYTSAQGKVLFHYPQDWLLTKKTPLPLNFMLDIVVANTQDALTRDFEGTNGPFAPGEVQIEVIVGARQNNNEPSTTALMLSPYLKIGYPKTDYNSELTHIVGTLEGHGDVFARQITIDDDYFVTLVLLNAEGEQMLWRGTFEAMYADMKDSIKAAESLPVSTGS